MKFTDRHPGWRRKTKKFIRSTLLWILAATYVIPIVFTVCNSFMNETEINAGYGKIFGSVGGKGGYVSDVVHLKFIPDFVSFKQYFTVFFNSPDYLFKFWNSVILVVPIVVFQMLVALLAAYGFTRYRGKLREIIFFAYVILMLTPYQVTLVPNYLVTDAMGLLNTRWAIWLPGVFSPFSVFILTKFMRRIPSGMIEAAKMDGAGEFKIFMELCVPMCKSSIASVCIGIH